MKDWYDLSLIKYSIIGHGHLYINPEREKNMYMAFVDENTDVEEAKIIYYFVKKWLEDGYIKIASTDDANKYKRVYGKVRKYIEILRKSDINILEIIAKRKGIEVTHNEDGTATINSYFYTIKNVPENMISVALEYSLRDIPDFWGKNAE